MALTQISTAGVKDDAVTAGKIPANAVGSSELADNAVDTAAIANNAVNSDKIATNAVNTTEIADTAVTLAKLEHGTSSNDGKFLRANNGADPTFETVTGTTINNNNAGRVITGSGTANTLEGNTKFTFAGDLVKAEKRMVIGNGTDFQIPSRSHTSSYTPQFQVTGAWNDPTHGATLALNGRTDYPLLWLNSGASFADNSGSGYIVYSIKDGAGNYCNTAAIRSRVDGTVGNNISPGALIFQTASAGTCQNSDRVTIDSSGNTTIHDGNLVIGTSGHGIDFSATYDGSNVSGVTSSSELLADFEEGTFTPILKRLMTNGVTETNFYTQGTREGNYTRVGDRVWITGRIHWNGGSTGSGNTIMTNLPFTVATGGANEVPLVIGYKSGWNYTNMSAYGAQNMNRFVITWFDSSGTHALSPSAAASQGTFYFAGHYKLV